MVRPPQKVMFLCTGNSARSQMAEGLARQLGQGLIDAYSAGVRPKDIHPFAIAAMDQIHIDIRNQTSKAIDPLLLNQMDMVITVCSNAEAQCPMTPPHIRREHWAMNDPAQTEGSEAERFESFCKARDQLKDRISEWLSRMILERR